jgi:hypothetical protein
MYKESRDNWAKMIDVDGGKLGSDRDPRGVSVGDERDVLEALQILERD